MKFGQSNFNWINEGVSIYVAGQLDKYKMPKEFKGFLDDVKVYEESGSVIKLVIDNFGKEKLFEFLHKQNGISEINELKSVFEEIFKEKLDYSYFNTLIK